MRLVVLATIAFSAAIGPAGAQGCASGVPNSGCPGVPVGGPSTAKPVITVPPADSSKPYDCALSAVDATDGKNVGVVPQGSFGFRLVEAQKNQVNVTITCIPK
jgi:hypothetical protein